MASILLQSCSGNRNPAIRLGASLRLGCCGKVRESGLRLGLQLGLGQTFLSNRVRSCGSEFRCRRSDWAYQEFRAQVPVRASVRASARASARASVRARVAVREWSQGLGFRL